MKYFIDDNIWYHGEKQPPRKVRLPTVIPDPNGRTALCYDEDENEYTLNLSDIKEEIEIKYGCDICGERKDWDTEIHWITSSYGVCDECYDKLSKDDIARIEEEYE